MGCVGRFFVAIEIKTDIGKSSALQTYKREQIKKCGSIALVISPSTMEENLKFLNQLSNTEE